jgi:hypothetical protein
MDSGGFLSKARSAVSSARSKAKGYAQRKMFERMTPKIPDISSFKMPGLPSGKATQSAANNLESQPIWLKIVILLIVTGFVGILFAYIHKKESTFGFNTLNQGLIVVAIVVIGLGLAYFMKFDKIDFLISSQINLLCFYFLISYAGLTALLTPDGFFSNFLDIFVTAGQIISDPTQIFEKGFSLIIPIIFFLIPLIILLKNATKNIWLALASVATAAGIVYILYPKNNVNPIAGGQGFDLGTANCREHSWEIWKKKCD